jgi:hypothetical protein
LTTTTAETDPAVIEGEIVTGNEGPQADTPGAVGEENSSPETPGGEVATRTEKQPEVSDLTPAAARKLADRIKRSLNGAADITERMNKSVEDAASLMSEAFAAKIWLALEEESWEDFVSKELGEVRVRLERGVRQSLVYRMAETAHMSTRAIAPVFGVDQKTVSNDLRQVRRELGTDAAPTVQGRDGQVQSAAPRQRRPRPIEERFANAIQRADAAVGDLTAISVEDGFGEASLAKGHRADIARLLDALKGVQDRLQ